jgi:hypothetical protein
VVRFLCLQAVACSYRVADGFVLSFGGSAVCSTTWVRGEGHGCTVLCFAALAAACGHSCIKAHAEAELTWMIHGPVQAGVTRLPWSF